MLLGLESKYFVIIMEERLKGNEEKWLDKRSTTCGELTTNPMYSLEAA